MIDNPNIEILFNTEYKDIIKSVNFDKLIYTGMIDSYFDYIHGELPYRSLNFDFKTVNTPRFQATCQVNFPNEHDYTRITEFNHFLDYKTDKTTMLMNIRCNILLDRMRHIILSQRVKMMRFLENMLKKPGKYQVKCFSLEDLLI